MIYTFIQINSAPFGGVRETSKSTICIMELSVLSVYVTVKAFYEVL